MTAVSPAEFGVSTDVSALRRSPLADRAEELAARSLKGCVELREEAFLTQVNLRADPRTSAGTVVEKALDCVLPEPNRVMGDERNAVLWLGPDEWLVVGPDGQAPAVVGAAREAAADRHVSCVDVSANRTTLRLFGPSAREVLETVCSLDLHPRVFSTGQCAQTLVGRVPVILWQVSEEPAYRILVRCSFAIYLAELLLDAMAGFATG